MISCRDGSRRSLLHFLPGQRQLFTVNNQLLTPEVVVRCPRPIMISYKNLQRRTYVRRSSQLKSSNLIDEFLGLTVKRVITLTVAAIFDLSTEANPLRNNRPSGSASLAALYSLDEDKM